jgi:hypothetical protein
LINRINRKWAGDRVVFDQQDYEDLAQAYWARYQHRVQSLELSEAQTLALVARCRSEGVTVNSALSTAFVGAQAMILGESVYHSSLGVAGSLRDRLRQPAGEAMGFYAGVVQLELKYDLSDGFWENARQHHRQVRPLYTNKKLFQDMLMWNHLDPTILEAINFKKLGRLVPEHLPRHQKLAAFAARDDAVLAILKRDKMESLEQIIMGTAVTNLTRLDFPRSYGSLELERLIMKPGGAFPLVNVNLVLGAVTCAGQLSLLVEHVEENIDTRTMERICAQALAFLLDA